MVSIRCAERRARFFGYDTFWQQACMMLLRSYQRGDSTSYEEKFPLVTCVHMTKSPTV